MLASPREEEARAAPTPDRDHPGRVTFSVRILQVRLSKLLAVALAGPAPTHELEPGTSADEPLGLGGLAVRALLHGVLRDGLGLLPGLLAALADVLVGRHREGI